MAKYKQYDASFRLFQLGPIQANNKAIHICVKCQKAEVDEDEKVCFMCYQSLTSDERQRLDL